MNFKLIYLARRNPSIAAEDWPRMWRSHAVFASQFPDIGAHFSSLLYCSRIFFPSLEGAPFAPPGASQDHDGAAIVASPSRDGLNIDMAPETRARIEQDELRVFDVPTPHCTLRCKETLVYGGAAGEGAVIRFLKRKPGESPGDFLRHFRKRHAETAMSAARAAPRITRYVQNELAEDPPPGCPFDGVSETWFAAAQDAVQSFADPTLAPVSADLSAFCDLERSVTLLTQVIHRWPRRRP
jgi:hypothetical protein